MRDLHNLYVENSSVNLTKKIYKAGKIKQVFLDFLEEDFPGLFGDVKYRIYDEYDYSKNETIGEGPEFYCEYNMADFCVTYSFTDYTFMICIHHKGERGIRNEDRSCEWIQYLSQRLHGQEKDEYIKGLKEFTNKLSKNFENLFLSAISTDKELDK